MSCQQTKGLHLTNIVVPEVVDFRDTVSLSCSYNMGNHTLNSVKWYKDDNEFFRCEISGDAPEFKLISKTSKMTIAALPTHDPIIHGLQPTYSIGEFLIANCSTDRSSPAASLYWYIDDEKASPDYLQPPHETTINTDGFILRSRSVEIRFRIDKTRLAKSRGIMKMKCLAKIDQFPAATREKTAKVFIMSADDFLNNQKLINWRNSEIRKVPTIISFDTMENLREICTHL
ncbi:hypothetical protein Bhyg_11756 [Pseudolycoriella hygida]|uniref:Ig-like domain-containing protein n=1 Tax=Pseudolycoriella hygida TaxID=35572 RepID=A0A9Q0RZV5_9DIPT|nr:hypothetical protein Bhyg_11756 [Pseudolycoriella hygida]